MIQIITTRLYVSPDAILYVDATLPTAEGTCILSVLEPGGHTVAVGADLADVAKLLEW